MIWYIHITAELLHGNRLSESYNHTDFVKLVELWCNWFIEKPCDVDDTIKEMIKIKSLAML